MSLALAPWSTPSNPEKANPPLDSVPRLAATRQSRRNCDRASRRRPARRLRLSRLRSRAASVSFPPAGALGFWPCESSTSSSSASTSSSSSLGLTTFGFLPPFFIAIRRLCAVASAPPPPPAMPPAAPMSWLIIISCMDACSSAVGPESVRYLAVLTAVEVRFSTLTSP